MRLSSALVNIYKIAHVIFQTTSQFFFKFWITLPCQERKKKKLLCTFLAQTIYTLLKRSPLKWKFMRLLSVWIKISQIPQVNFENDKTIPLQIFHHSSVSLHATPLYIFSSCIFYFGQKDYIKVSILTVSSVLVKICHIIFHLLFSVIFLIKH